MNNGENFGRSVARTLQVRSDTGELIFITQLLQSTRTMFHIDDLFYWLDQQFVQRLQMQVAQCWALQFDQRGREILEMRAHVYQDISLPVPIVTNERVVALVNRIASERSSAFFQPVEAIFSPYQTILLKRYGLHYLAGCFVQQNILLPPPESETAADRLPSPLRLVWLFFARQASAQKLLPLVRMITAQALQVAKDRSLLIPASGGKTSLALIPWSSPFVCPPLPELIPARVENSRQFRAHLGLLSIDERGVRRLYRRMDGRLNVRELALVEHMTIEEALQHLRLLLSQKRIQFFEPEGKPVDSEELLKKL